MSRAVVLLSGGLDSTTVAAIAVDGGFEVHALTVAYGQRHQVELAASARVARALGITDHRLVTVDLDRFGASALTDRSIEVPQDRPLAEIGAAGDVPATYVPARNTVLCALALAFAESIDARDLFIGVNVLDASGYPDCRPAFVAAFEALANVATRAADFRLHAPLIDLSKAEIIARGVALGVDYAMTHSCYQPRGELACGRCDACLLRRKGFVEAGVPDPTRYDPGR